MRELQKQRIHEEQIEAWLGNGNDYSRADFVQLLAEIINGEYLPEDFKKDVLDYDRNNEEGV
jgi:hypothetical protein